MSGYPHSIFTTVDVIEEQTARNLNQESQTKEIITVCGGYSLGFKGLSSLLQACNELQQIHGRILMSGLAHNIVLVAKLVTLYGTWDGWESA